jgi:hypothetical protein
VLEREFAGVSSGREQIAHCELRGVSPVGSSRIAVTIAIAWIQTPRGKLCAEKRFACL